MPNIRPLPLGVVFNAQGVLLNPEKFPQIMGHLATYGLVGTSFGIKRSTSSVQSGQLRNKEPLLGARAGIYGSMD